MTNLRTSVMQAVRRGAWTGDEAENARGVARISMRSAALDLDCSAYDVALALCVISKAPFASPHAEVASALDAARATLAKAPTEAHRLVSPFYGRFTTRDALESCRSDLEAVVDGLRMNETEAAAAIRVEVDRLKPLFPELNLSFGYIGSIWHDRDDRGFRVFTTLATPECRGGCDVTFGDAGAEDLGLLLRRVRAGLEAWCLDKQQKLARRELRQVRQAA